MLIFYTMFAESSSPKYESVPSTGSNEAEDTSELQASVDVPKGDTNEESELENLFKDRYSEKDEEYMQTLNTPLAPPPCVENWYVRPKRTYDWSRYAVMAKKKALLPQRFGSDFQHRSDVVLAE